MGQAKRQRHLDYLKSKESSILFTDAAEAIQDNNFVSLVKKGLIVVEPYKMVEIRK